MKVTAKEEAGLQVMAMLARLAERGPIPLKEVADQTNISLAYLEKVVPDLRRAGLIESERGVNGGYALARPSETITVAETLRALNGDILNNLCVGASLDDDPCARIGACPMHPVWDRLYLRIDETLSGITLKDLT